jgi:hypothetical protein
MAIRELTVQDRVFPSSPCSHKMSLGSTFGAMFIALLIDAMWILSFDRFMYFSILANLQSVWHRHSASFFFCQNSKLSSPQQLLVLQYYFVSIHESDNWLIKTMVNDPILNSIGIINTDMLGRSPWVCILFFSSFCPRVWDQTSNYKDLLWLSTPPVSAILCINHSSPTLGTTRLWMSYQCTPSLLLVYTSWNIDIILLQHWLCTLWLLTGMFKYLRMFLFTDSGGSTCMYISVNLCLPYWWHQHSILSLLLLDGVTLFCSTSIYILIMPGTTSFFVARIWSCKFHTICSHFHNIIIDRSTGIEWANTNCCSQYRLWGFPDCKAILFEC